LETPEHRLRAVIVAENASFRFGGEASLPLHYFSRLRRRGFDVWLLAHSRTLPELEALFPADRNRILTIPDTWLHKLFWNVNRLLPRRVYEATFGTLIALINQYMQRQMVRKLVREHGIQLVHQPTPVSPRAPSFLSGFGIPVLIGPMNGGMQYPTAFRHDESKFTRAFVAAGRAGAELANRIIPGKKYARMLLVANQRTKDALPSCAQGEIAVLSENGADLDLWMLRQDAAPRGDHPMFLFVGRLVDWKRLDIALHALARLPGASLEVIGEGPMHESWSNLAASLGIGDRVQFLGWLTQPECAQRLQKATALLLPSVFECGGAVVLEAMAGGVPVIATAWGGPTDYLDSSCGILVEPVSEQALISGFAQAMEALFEDEALAMRLGSTGRARVEQQYDWARKIDAIVDIYQRLQSENQRNLRTD
jgi:glycosyltransferase involved in cell wall biosynthesis